MRAGSLGTFVISWAQTEIDSLRAGPVASIQSGGTWRWSGKAVRVDGPNDIFLLGGATNTDDMQERAAIAVRRLIGRALPPQKAQNGEPYADPLFSNTFVVTDGYTSWTATIIEVPEAARPLLMFIGRLPPEDQDLWIAREPQSEGQFRRISESPTGVICFTPGTRLQTPDGERLVEDLAEGDRIDTKDGGAQEIVWIGRRRISGARLYAMPELRPVRILGQWCRDRERSSRVHQPRHGGTCAARAAWDHRAGDRGQPVFLRRHGTARAFTLGSRFAAPRGRCPALVRARLTRRTRPPRSLTSLVLVAPARGCLSGTGAIRIRPEDNALHCCPRPAKQEPVFGSGVAAEKN